MLPFWALDYNRQRDLQGIALLCKDNPSPAEHPKMGLPIHRFYYGPCWTAADKPNSHLTYVEKMSGFLDILVIAMCGQML